MKNPEELINEVALAIDEFKKTHDEGCSIFLDAGVIFVREFNNPNPSGTQVRKLTKYEVTHGLTPAQWNILADEMMEVYLEQRRKCQRQKP